MGTLDENYLSRLAERRKTTWVIFKIYVAYPRGPQPYSCDEEVMVLVLVYYYSTPAVPARGVPSWNSGSSEHDVMAENEKLASILSALLDQQK
jgi:hypothetical protein